MNNKDVYVENKEKEMGRKLSPKEKNRIKEFPDTDFFHWYNKNPKGNIAGDCVFRAISLAMGKTWEETYKDLFEFSVKIGYVANEKECYGKFLEENGWVRGKCPKHSNGKKYDFLDVCKELRKQGHRKPIIAHAGSHHVVVIKDFKVWDIWNSSFEKIGVYWYKK